MESTIREIRIHGVSGTPPEAMLDLESAADVERVAGDTVTGFWRRRAEGAAKLPQWMLPPARSPVPWSPVQPRLPWDVEAYSWGSLTSGARGSLSRAAWLLLIPFALVNMASWARPGLAKKPPDANEPSDAAWFTFKADPWAAVVVRLTGLALTGLLITAAAIVSIDLIGYQCFRGGDLLCPSLPSQLHFLAEQLWEAPGRRVAVGAIGPLVVLGLLWWLGRVTVQRYEDVPDRSEGTDATTTGPTAAAASGKKEPKTYPHLLESMTMWNGRRRWRTLAAWHLVAGFATVLVIVGWVTAQIGGWGPSAFTGVGAGVVLAGLAVLGVVRASDGPETEGNHSTQTHTVRRRRDARAARWAVWGAAIVTLAFLGWVGRWPGRGHDFVDLTAFEVITTALVVLAGVGVMLGIVAWASGTGDWRRPALIVAVLVGPAALVAFALPPDWPWWSSPLILGIAVAAAVLLHSLQPGDQRSEWAFRGAGPGVMLGGALFVSLLFTTASALGVVVWLTGPSELASMPATYAKPTLCPAHEPNQSAAATQTDCSRLVAFGEVELLDGVVEFGEVEVQDREDGVEDDRPQVTSGRLSVASLAIDGDNGRVSTAIPSLTIDGPVTVVLADDRALSSDDTDPGSRATRTRIVPEADPPGDPVTITATEGVVIETRQPPYQNELLVPPVIRTFATVFPVFLPLTVGLLGAGWWRLTRRKPRESINARATGDLAHETQPPPVDLPDALREMLSTDSERYEELPADTGRRLIGAMVRLRRSSAFARRGEALLGRVATIGGAGMLFAVVSTLGELRSDRVAAASPFTVAGLYLCVGAAFGLLALGAAVRRDAAFRRPVGVLWDLSCFWPRVAHPFSPPCYAERAVPDLYERLHYCTREERRTLLSGHSLGSFLAVAAICRLPHNYDTATGPRENLGLLTYGSQLRYYWGRAFPGAFGPQVLGNHPATRLPLGQYEYPPPSNRCAGAPRQATIASQLGVRATPADSLGQPDVPCRWVNLYRLTDPLGFTVFSDDRVSPDRRNAGDRPVFEVALPAPGDPTPPKLLGHSGYPLAPEYHEWAWRLAQQLPTTQPSPPAP